MGHQSAMGLLVLGSDVVAMDRHQQVQLPGVAGVTVDGGMVALLAAAAQAGARTLHSCQGDVEESYMMFAAPADLEIATRRWSHLARATGQLPLAIRICSLFSAPLGPDGAWVRGTDDLPTWRYELHWLNDFDDPGQIVLRATVRFSLADRDALKALCASPPG